MFQYGALGSIAGFLLTAASVGIWLELAELPGARGFAIALLGPSLLIAGLGICVTAISVYNARRAYLATIKWAEYQGVDFFKLKIRKDPAHCPSVGIKMALYDLETSRRR